MLNTFGDNEEFGIEYYFKENIFGESGIFKESWGVFRLWINGVNICKFTQSNSEKDYEWNLIYLVEWLCENLEYILGFDPFPLPITGGNVLELIKKSDEFESDDDDEMYLWHQAKSRWVHRHNWFCNICGSYLPSVYFQRINDEFELSWDNGFWKDQGIEFISIEGSCKIEGYVFKNVIFSFLDEILSRLETSIETKLSSEYEHILTLHKKAMLLKP